MYNWSINYSGALDVQVVCSFRVWMNKTIYSFEHFIGSLNIAVIVLLVS